jgi:histidinol-phosphate aminotransferase
LHVPRAKRQVESLTPYSAPLEGRRPKLRLDFNENTVGPSPKVVEAIRALPPEAYAIYPEYAGLAEAYAEYLGLAADQVLPFNGVDGAIRAIFDAYGAEGATFLSTDPTFGYYGPCARQQGMQVKGVPYLPDLAFPLEAFRAELAKAPAIAFVCNPNNPTGTLLPAETLLELCRAAPDTLLVIDELYADFSGVTVLPQALELDNVIVLRSLSKTAGLAALRIGFALAQPALLSRLARVVGPYDINMFGVVAAHAALEDRPYVDAYVAKVAEARRFSVERLQALGLRHFAGGGNYMLVWPPRDNAAVVAALDARGVLVRSMDGKTGIGGSFRLTVGTVEQMRRFFEVFEAIIAG